MAGENKNYQKADVIARLFGKTTRRIQQLTQDGVLPTEQTPEGRRYDLLPTIKRYIQYLEARAEKQQPQSLNEKIEKKLDAEIKYKEAKASKAKLELDELKGKLHRAEDIEKLTNELVFAVRSMLLALPGRVAMDVAAINTAPEVSQYMARHVAVLLDELATHEYNPDTYKQLVREREGWETDHDSDSDDEEEI
jgi:phage terminase Nu1 subunit (DNA packaging protein)